jgi:Fe-S cluster assembly ATP-binding protein
MLNIQNLFSSINEKEILHGINFIAKPGEVHMWMGPNGSGKSTLARTIVGFPEYKITSGEILLDKKDITTLGITERALAGIFMGFQHPVDVPGVNFRNFLRLAFNSRLPKDEQLPVFKFKDLLTKKAEELEINPDLLDRDLNYQLSGGEKKKMEMLQMAILEPRYIILDEIDSGLDTDAVKTIFGGVKRYKEGHPEAILIIISHYEKILNFIKPDFVHVLNNGRIIKSGTNELITAINKNGYQEIINSEG